MVRCAFRTCLSFPFLLSFLSASMHPILTEAEAKAEADLSWPLMLARDLQNCSRPTCHRLPTSRTQRCLTRTMPSLSPRECFLPACSSCVGCVVVVILVDRGCVVLDPLLNLRCVTSLRRERLVPAEYRASFPIFQILLVHILLPLTPPPGTPFPLSPAPFQLSPRSLPKTSVR